jgi:BirA family biotin operon repressor/biotin-[acetyl-CoA-carboxylase] ligase
VNTIGKLVLELDSVDSTNRYAERILASGPVEEGTVIWAQEQTAGMGQGENAWNSEPGKNLTFTIILTPGFLPAGKQFLLNKAITLGITDFLKKYIKDVLVKWPNDIYVGKKKLGGILITHRIAGSHLDTTIVGIGLNVNQTKFSKDIPNPASMSGILHKKFRLRIALIRLLAAIDKRYLQLRNQEFKKLDEKYQNVLMGAGKWRTYCKGEESFEGRIIGVDEFGKLQLETRSGNIELFSHREVEYWL